MNSITMTADAQQKTTAIMTLYSLTLYCMMSVAVLPVCATASDSSEQLVAMPQVGDYGTELVTSISLTTQQIEQLNAETYPKPFNQQRSDDTYTLQFFGDNEKNPYRVVIIATGRTINEGKVDIKFAGILAKTEPKSDDRPTPQLYREEDDAVYRVYQKSTFIMTSEPFSFSSNKINAEQQIQIQLTHKDNINFENVDIQVWQGKGTKQSQYSVYKLFLIIFIGMFIAYRMVFGVRH